MCGGCVYVCVVCGMYVWEGCVWGHVCAVVECGVCVVCMVCVLYMCVKCMCGIWWERALCVVCTCGVQVCIVEG